MHCGLEKCEYCPINQNSSLYEEITKSIKSNMFSTRVTNHMKIFLERSQQHYNKISDRYNYILVPSHYVNATTKVPIICNKCNKIIWQQPSVHCGSQRRSGCEKCSQNKKLVPFEDILERCKRKHGDNIILKQQNYENTHSKVKVTCKKHNNTFTIIINSLINNGSNGCNECISEIRSQQHTVSFDIFISRLKSDQPIIFKKYKIIKDGWTGVKSKVIIICPIHGRIKTNAYTLLKGHGCKQCGIKQCTKQLFKDTRYFIIEARKIHGDKYEYHHTNYVRWTSPILVTCKKHGNFEISRAGRHLQKDGKRGNCPKCVAIEIKQTYSMKCIEWFKSLGKDDEIQHALNGGEKIIKLNIPDEYGRTYYKLDGYCKETNTAYEFHGDLWHGNPNKFNMFDVNPINKEYYGVLFHKTYVREENLKKLGYNLVVMWEEDYDKLSKS